MVLLVGFSSCPVFGPRHYTRCCVGIFLQRTRHWFSSPRFRTRTANLSCPRFLFFFQAWYCVVILATVGCETVVFRLLPSSVESCPVFHNRSQRRRDVISLALLFALSSPWKGPLELYLFSVTLGLALRLNRLKVCPFFWFSAWAAHSAPSLVDICRASVLSVS